MNKIFRLIHKHLRSIVILTGSVSLMCLFLVAVLDIDKDIQFILYMMFFSIIAATNYLYYMFNHKRA